MSSNRFRKKPSAKAVARAINWEPREECFKAAAKLPTRQIANAMAGVPEYKWRTSLDLCTASPCEYSVGIGAREYYRSLFKMG
jgi:hypothetical protein